MCSLGALQARQTLEVEGAPLLPVQRPRPERAQLAKRQAPQGGHEGEDVDWLTTSLLFLFPAIGGLLFGCALGGTGPLLLREYPCPACCAALSTPSTAFGPPSNHSCRLPRRYTLQVRHRGHQRRAGVHDQPAVQRYRLVQPVRLPVGTGGQPVAGGRSARLR